jgi:tripeptide aminopeptidase
VRVRGESRSHDPRFARKISEVWARAFTSAARSVKNHEGKCGSVRFELQTDYAPFRLSPGTPVVRRAVAAAESLGLTPKLVSVDGGLDANWLNAKGLPTVTFGAGQHSPHTETEYVDLREFVTGCRLAIALATDGA